MQDTQNIYLTYDAISLKLDFLASRIQQQPFDAIVMVLRGGSFAGMHMAFATGLPYYFLSYDRSELENRWVGEPPPPGRLLLIEDFAGMGRTLIDSREFLTKAGYRVQTLVVCKDLKSASVPDYYCFDCRLPNKRFILPWERHMLNPDVTPEAADHEFYRTVWNIDDHFFASTVPALTIKKQDLIIAEFSPLHKQRLASLNFSAAVIFKKKEPAAKKQAAHWKGQLALALGYTHFVESDAEQAIYLAELFPELKIRWRNSGRLIDIQTAAYGIDSCAL